jgi:hypothetical protein
MSYNLRLQCGCLVVVSCHAQTAGVDACVIQTRGFGCRVMRHEAGFRLFAWEILPEPVDRSHRWWHEPSEPIGPQL